jgi:tetratricopeptide (TPR) repeat protein
MAEGTDELRIWRVAGVAATLAVALSVPLYLGVKAARGPRAQAPPAPLYVGSEACGECHKKEYDSWRKSNHALAMLAPREDTVLGDFGGATFEERGQVTRFYRKDGTYFVHAPGPEGVPGDFEVAYSFGWFPLQQYLVAFPGGRLQCLSMAWDVPRRRWFSLYPDQAVAPDDWLYWTRPAMNWNTMCSACHSTGVQKRYDPQTDTFQTTWAEIMVGCEACHGPGSRHAEWGKKPPMARPQVENALLTVKTSAMPQRELVNLCMPCHSRRAELRTQSNPGGEPLDHYLPVLLSPGLFYPDGQILDEDYEYHGFIQSKMFEKGVKCNDCHDVHRARRYQEGNALCLKCHRADTYDTASHHFHKTLVGGRPSEGASCPACHMPGRNYMVIHFRRDHSIRVPRPDLSRQDGTPNACTQAGCHADKPLSWSVDAYEKWYGKARKPHYGTVIAAARERKPEARAGLLALCGDRLRPAIVRATALELLSGYPGEDSTKRFEEGLSDEDALIRRTAASQIRYPDPARLVKALAPLLKDSVYAVRVEAASRLTEVPPELLTGAQTADYQAALQEYAKVLAYTADMPSGRYNWGILEQNLGHAEEAERQYLKAIEMDGRFYLAKVNLALLLNQLGRNEEAEGLLRQAVKEVPGNAAVAFDLGLLLAEMGKEKEAETALRRALQTDPSMAQAAYNLAILVAQEKPGEAVEMSRRAAELRPDEPRYAFTLAYYQVQAGDTEGARRTLEALVSRSPAHGDAVLLLGGLYEQQGRVQEARALYERSLALPDLPPELRTTIQGRIAAVGAPPRRDG